jgi:DNA-binding GntR family transcriptional regulator
MSVKGLTGSDKTVLPRLFVYIAKAVLGFGMANQTDVILAKLLTRIERGTLSPGDVLEEKKLCADFQLSRTPVREALIRLETLGIVRRKPRGGAVVFKPRIDEFLAILEVHAKLEGQAAALAARRIDKEGAKILAKALLACEAHLKQHGESKPNDYYRCNLDFHKAVARAACNDVLYGVIASNAYKLLAYYRARYAYKGSIPTSVAEHQLIAAAIAERDAEKAESLMAKHVNFDSVTAMDLVAMFDRPNA